MPWGNKFPDMKNDPTYLEGRLSNAETSLADMAHQSITTTFNTDGSITEIYASGLIKTTTFNANGSITEVYSAPINKTKVITVNSDGSISEVVS